MHGLRIGRQYRSFIARDAALYAAYKTQGTGFSKIVYSNAFLVTCIVIFLASPSIAQVNRQGQLPYLGWSSWSQEVINGAAWATEAQIKAESDALKSSGLQAHGFIYINIDSGWASGFDGNGRPMVNSSKYPDGMAATIQYIHNNGQKAGIYWIPGVQQPVYDANYPILGTAYTIQNIVLPNTPGNAFSYGQSSPYHKKIDFTQPGAQEYVNSVVNLFASWGVDFIKLDGVTPGSDHDDLTIDNRPDVTAWSQAIAQSGRPIWLTVSWDLDHDYLSTWQAYANARRLEDDVECYCATLTTWNSVAKRFNDLVAWQYNAGPTMGWNDLDSLDVGNGSQDGLSNDERQSVVTLWAIANAPLFVGDDLTKLDSFGLQLLTNDGVIAIDQTGLPGTQVAGGNNPVWVSSKLPNGKYNVALFNLSGGTSATSVSWSSLGFSGSADVYDVWNDTDLGIYADGFSAPLLTHASELLKITPVGGSPAMPIRSGNTYRVVNKNSGSVLDDPGSSTANGTFMDQWQIDGGANQEWVANAVGSYWTFTNVASGKVLDDPGSDLLPNTQLDQWQNNGGTNQNWSIVAVGDGTYKVVSQVSGLVMDVRGGSKSNDAAIIQYTDKNAANQHWTFQPQ